jgi:hypothetical protein
MWVTRYIYSNTHYSNLGGSSEKTDPESIDQATKGLIVKAVVTLNV